MTGAVDAKRAVALLKEWFPKPEEARAVTRVLARSIRLAHAAAPNSWELTLRRDKVRLNVGQIAVAELYEGDLVLYTMHLSKRVSNRGIERDRDRENYRAFPGKHDRWFVRPSAASKLPKSFLVAHQELVQAAWTAKRKSPFKKSHTAAAVEALSELTGVALEQPEYHTANADGVAVDSANGSALGDPDVNPDTERAAVEAVWSHLESQGWSITSREHEDGCGYDLHCRRGAAELCVEVKGLSGTAIRFVFTPPEFKAAQELKTFRFAVVTAAGTEMQRINIFDSKQFEKEFVVSPFKYVARYVGSRAT